MALLAIVGNPPSWTADMVRANAGNKDGVVTPWGWFWIAKGRGKFQVKFADKRLKPFAGTGSQVAEYLNALLLMAQGSGRKLNDLHQHLLVAVGQAGRARGAITLLDAARRSVRGWRRNPVIKATSHAPITEASYPGLFQDRDDDGIPDADDPQPTVPGTESVEEVRLSDELRELVHLRERYEGMRQRLVERIGSMVPGAEVKSRTKTPYSIVNKLRRKRLEGSKGITDLVGAMIVAKDQVELDRVVNLILSGALGPVLEHEDLYATPREGYRAHHFVLSVDGMPAEVQVKTKRMKAIAGASHHAYKTGKLDPKTLLELTDLAVAADSGDPQAAETIDFYLSDPHQLEQLLTKRKNPPGHPSTWRDPSATQRLDRVHEAQLLAIRYEQDQAERELRDKVSKANPSTTVSNVYTGESYSYDRPAAEVMEQLAHYHRLPQPVDVAGYLRSGPWIARAARRNPGKKGQERVGSFWYQLLDTVHHAMHSLAEQQGGRGVVSIAKKQWLQLYPRIKPGGGKVDQASAEKAYERFRQRIQEEDAQGAGIMALDEPQWLHLNVANAFDAAWRAMPGKHHQLGEGRELELGRAQLDRVRGMRPGLERGHARRAAQRGIQATHAYYDALDRSVDPDGDAIPGGSLEEYEAIKRRVAGEGQLALRGQSGRLETGARQNRGRPKEPRTKPPKVTRMSLEEAKKMPGFNEALKKYRTFHDADPEHVDVYHLPDGKKAENWEPVHAALHLTVETPYVVDWESNKEGHLWLHEHPDGGEPLEVIHPFANMTKKILRGSKVGEWWFS